MSSVPQTPRRGRCCSPVDAGVEKISPSAAVPHVPASSIGSASLAFIPAFDFVPPGWEAPTQRFKSNRWDQDNESQESWQVCQKS